MTKSLAIILNNLLEHIITVHYKTYNPAATAEEIKNLVGKQSEEIENLIFQAMKEKEK